MQEVSREQRGKAEHDQLVLRFYRNCSNFSTVDIEQSKLL